MNTYVHDKEVAPKLPHDIGLPAEVADMLASIHCTCRTQESVLCATRKSPPEALQGLDENRSNGVDGPAVPLQRSQLPMAWLHDTQLSRSIHASTA